MTISKPEQVNYLKLFVETITAVFSLSYAIAFSKAWVAVVLPSPFGFAFIIATAIDVAFMFIFCYITYSFYVYGEMRKL